jgi:hypothetical protein
VKVSLHAQEFHRVPSAGGSKGRLDLVGRAGRRAILLPWERMRATPCRSAELVLFARRTGNQQFVKKNAYRQSGAGSPCARAIQAVEVGTCGVGMHHGIGVPHLSMVCSTLRNARPLLPQFGAALSARAGLGSIHSQPPCLEAGHSVTEVFVIPYWASDR